MDAQQGAASTEEHGKAVRSERTKCVYFALRGRAWNIFSEQNNTIKSPRQDAFVITAAESEVLYNLQTTQTFSSAPQELKAEMSSMYHQPTPCNTQTKRTPPTPHQDSANHIITFSREKNRAWNVFTVTIHPHFWTIQLAERYLWAVL